jgi:hypothetical protein
MRARTAAASSISPAAARSRRLSSTALSALSTAPATPSHAATACPARANTIAHARPMRPMPMMPIFSMRLPVARALCCPVSFDTPAQPRGLLKMRGSLHRPQQEVLTLSSPPEWAGVSKGGQRAR